MAAIAGARNAAWDITHLSDFIFRSNESANLGNVQYLLASFDAHLKLTTNLLMTVGREGNNASPTAVEPRRLGYAQPLPCRRSAQIGQAESFEDGRRQGMHRTGTSEEHALQSYGRSNIWCSI